MESKLKKVLIATCALVIISITCLVVYKLAGLFWAAPTEKQENSLEIMCNKLEQFADAVYNAKSQETLDTCVNGLKEICTPSVINDIRDSLHYNEIAEQAKSVCINVSYARKENTADGAEKYLISVKREYALGTENVIIQFIVNSSGVIHRVEILNKFNEA